MTDETEGLCRHCGMPIVLMRYVQRDQWMHRLDSDPDPQAEHLSLYCRTTVAEPGVALEGGA